MKIKNPLTMNDWDIKNFLIIVVSIQLSIIGLILLSNFQIFNLLIIRVAIGCIYLLYIPGLLLLRIFKLHNLGSVKTTLFSIGLSITTIIGLGFFINTTFPLLGFTHPISIMCFIITLSIAVSFLCYLSYKIDNYPIETSYINLKDAMCYISLLFILALSIIGTYLVNFYNNTLLLYVFLFVVSIFIILSVCTKLISNNIFPFLIFIISLSLLYHNALISSHIWGWDIFVEYNLANLVLQNSIWNSSLYSNVNPMLSIVMLAPLLSITCNLDLTWVFKLIFPLIFSFVPVGLYILFKDQTNDIISFLACIFFVSLNTFYVDMFYLARQQIAELFLVLILLIMVSNILNYTKKTSLILIFSISLILSHYGLSFIFIFMLIVSCIIYYIYKLMTINKYNNILLNIYIIVPLIVFLYTWYVYNSNSSLIYSILGIGVKISTTAIYEFANSENSQGLYLLTKTPGSSLYLVYKLIQIACQISIFIGLIAVVLTNSYKKINIEYLIISYIAFIICVMAIIIPYFAGFLYVSRIYQIALIFLAPFCIIGLHKILTIFNAQFKFICIFNDYHIFALISIFIVIFLLFNSGVIFELAKDKPYSFSLNTTREFPIFSESDILSAQWLNSNANNYKVFGDSYNRLIFYKYTLNVYGTLPNDIHKGTYIYLGHNNILTNKLRIQGDLSNIYYDNIDKYIGSNYKLLDSGYSQIYYQQI